MKENEYKLGIMLRWKLNCFKKHGLVGQDNLLRADLTEQEWDKVEVINNKFDLYFKIKYYFIRKINAFCWHLFTKRFSVWNNLMYRLHLKNPW